MRILISNAKVFDGDPTKDVGIPQDRNNLKMIVKGGKLYKSPDISGAAPREENV